jgi:NAD(P)-dependent dehydrogenase (short-subunit alcohol dehydrogenase family)
MTQMWDLNNTNCLVTGSSRGIGRAIAVDLAACGASVAINYVSNQKAADEVVNEITDRGGKAFAVKADASDKKQVCDLFEKVADKFEKLDVLVNNAGVLSRYDFVDIPEAEWDRLMNVNLKGYFLCGQQAARIMIRQGQGRIINISSISQVIPGRQRVHYCASKGGIQMLTKGMALELADHNITVNAVAPGSIHTDFTEDVLSDPAFYQSLTEKIPLSKIGRPEDISGAVLLLASKRGSYMTGQTIYVDGGYLL